MADALSGLLAGLNQGAQTGLQMYQAVEGQKRAQRLEDYQRERDAKTDTQWDSMYTLKKDEAAESKRQYDSTLGENVRQFDDTMSYRGKVLDADTAYKKGSLANQAAQTANDSRRISISENTYKDSKLAAEMERSRVAVATVMFDENGHLKGTPEELNSRLKAAGLDRVAGKVLAYMAPERYGQGNYSDVSMTVTPKGIVPVVHGTDMEGQPIKDGGAPATANGSAKDTQISAMPFGSAALALLNPNLISERQATYLANAQKQQAAQNTQAVVTQGVQAAKGTDADVGALSDELSAAENKLTELTTAREALTKAGPKPVEGSLGAYASVYSGGTSLADRQEAEKLDREIKSLSNVLDGKGGLHDQMRTKAAVQPGYMARGDAMYGAAANSIDLARSTQTGAQYLSNAAGTPAAKVKAAEDQQKKFATLEGDITGAIALPTTKDKKTGATVTPVTKAHLVAQLRNLPPEVQALVTRDPRAQAALFSTMQTMANMGQSTGLARFADAASRVDDLELYTKFVNDPANVGKTDDQRHEWAIASVQQRAPGESTEMSLGRTLPR